MKAKHLGEALTQLAEEGAARVFKTNLDSGWVVGVVGPLQFDVLKDRIRSEYNCPVRFEETELYTARWVYADDAKDMKEFLDKNNAAVAMDHDQDPVFVARNAWHLQDVQDKYPNIKFMDVK
jgi:peptide chain release factor 3